MTVIATVTSQLWCFPKRVEVVVIPRFKIVDVEFSLGPRGIPLVAKLFMLLGLLLAIIGGALGGCTRCNDDDWYCLESYSSGSCPMLVTGFLFLLIPLIPVIVLYFIRKRHYIYVDVKT